MRIDGGLVWQGSGTFNGLSLGIYFVDVMDANGCIISTPVTITEPPILVSTETIIPVSCYGLCDGSITAIVTGGTRGIGLVVSTFLRIYLYPSKFNVEI